MKLNARAFQKNLPESSGSTRDKVFPQVQKELWGDRWHIWPAQLDPFSISLLMLQGWWETHVRESWLAQTGLSSLQSFRPRALRRAERRPEVFDSSAIFPFNVKAEIQRPSSLAAAAAAGGAAGPPHAATQTQTRSPTPHPMHTRKHRHARGGEGGGEVGKGPT